MISVSYTSRGPQAIAKFKWGLYFIFEVKAFEYVSGFGTRKVGIDDITYPRSAIKKVGSADITLIAMATDDVFLLLKFLRGSSQSPGDHHRP